MPTETDVFWYLNLTEQQAEAYERFRSDLEASKQLVYGVDDKYTLLRFLKARQWDVEKAKLMYNKMGTWRTEHDVDTLYETYEFPELEKVLPYYPHFYQ